MKIKNVLINLIIITFLITGCNSFNNIKTNNLKHDIVNIFSDLYQKELQTVVQIEVSTNKLRRNRQGSGIIISKDGYVITNSHVVEDAKEIIVLMNDLKDYKATLIGIDTKTDVALLKIDSNDVFIAAKIGDSDNIKIGEWVVTIGSPFGLQNSISAGVVSGKNRPPIIKGIYGNYIQTDAAINPGNSGGPLFNLRGELIGINTTVIIIKGINSNIGFSIPINIAMFVVEQLKKDGEVTRGHIGIIVQSITSKLKKQYKLVSRRGAFVRDVFKNNPADKAGLKVNDVIIEFNNKKIKYAHELLFALTIAPIEKKLKLIILRNNEKKILTVILEKSNTNNIVFVPDFHEKFGYNIAIVDNYIANRLSIINKVVVEELIGRIIISKVVVRSSADLSGLKRDDIVIAINTKSIKSIEDYIAAILKISLDKPFLMVVLRDGNIIYLVLSIKAGNLL